MEQGNNERNNNCPNCPSNALNFTYERYTVGDKYITDEKRRQKAVELSSNRFMIIKFLEVYDNRQNHPAPLSLF
jgi:hypothetical protein